MVLENPQKRLIISILDYQESGARNEDERNVLLTSIELSHDGRSSIATVPIISTYELSALADWFEAVANYTKPKPVVLQEPCLFFDCEQSTDRAFQVLVRMEAEASPSWTAYRAEPFSIEFWLSHEQMIGAAQSLRRLHEKFPTQS
ncbi:hypothetical protein WBJ53_16980 [Spirosoma sp. SC4-14]|uniref:WapI family immunity protein n=1 Tax=Spirosoma sp. SC4-14 TaxID=3128900 RepID=UPI0030D4F5FB